MPSHPTMNPRKRQVEHFRFQPWRTPQLVTSWEEHVFSSLEGMYFTFPHQIFIEAMKGKFGTWKGALQATVYPF